MKRLVPLLFLLAGCAEMMGNIVPPQERALEMVHEVPLKKDEIFNRSLEWMAKTFVDSKEVIELKDKESGKIIGKGIVTFTNMGMATIPCRYTLTIEAKDGKYRASFENLTAMWGSEGGGANPQPLEYDSHINQVKPKLTALDADLNAFLLEKKKQDW